MDSMKDQGISRRGFLASASVAGAVAAFGALAGYAPQAPKSEATAGGAEAASAGKPSFMTAPEPIADSDIVETVETEVLVVGAGYSGLASALSASENGLKVLIAEKTGQANGRGAGTGAINSSYAVSQGAEVKDKAGANTGDGHKMSLWAGAEMQDAPFPPMLHPQRYCDKSSNQLQGPFMFVNQDGERFFNEGTWVQPKSLQIMQNTADGIAYTVFDSNWKRDLLDSLPYSGGMFWDSFRYLGSSSYDDTIEYYENSLKECLEMGTAFQTDTIEDLAKQIGAPADALKATVERYNGMYSAGEDTDFNKNLRFLYEIAEPPFYSTKVGACLLTIVGGIKVNKNLECLDAEGNPVKGLYAVGNASGSAYAVDYPINVPGNSHGRCLTWGYHAEGLLEQPNGFEHAEAYFAASFLGFFGKSLR